jgi:hypothetical protein
MERINEDASVLIDLGAASVETRGSEGLHIEPVGMRKPAGLSDED